MNGTRTALVTGASGGIGRAIAVALGHQGWTVAVGARRLDELKATAQQVDDAGGVGFAHLLDVCDEGSMDAFLAALTARHGPVDVLVNNAGVALPGALHEMEDADQRRIVATNLIGPMLLSKRVVAGLRAERRQGDIVFVSSDATLHPRPHLGAYSVAKSGLEAFARVLAMECEGHEIRTTVVRVGPTSSSFGDGWDPEIFAGLFPYWQRFGLQRHFSVMQPDDVARAVVAAVTAPPHVWVPVVEVQPRPPRA
ncbi:MAG: SDR family NAD(P)-dependent oxidoreductase [Actinomycetota bacterium]